MSISLNPTESYIDASIYGQDFSSMCLSLQLSLNEVSFAITNTNLGNCMAIVSYTFPEKISIPLLAGFIENSLYKQTLLKNDFLKVFISYKNDTATLIPSKLYDVTQISSYLKNSDSDTPDSSILSDFIKEIDAYNIYSFPKSIEEIILKKFTNSYIIHHSTNLIQGIYNNLSLKNEIDTFFVNICNNEFDLIVISNSKLLIYNSFKFKFKEDFLYYLLFSLKQINSNPSNIKLNLIGKIAGESSIHQILLKYISEVNFCTNSISENLNNLLMDQPEYYYFSLLNLNKCG
ncbi:MAG: DUF3822 family protein [Bacteroidales bacterium]